LANMQRILFVSSPHDALSICCVVKYTYCI
jgi:hypothetical protein